MRRLQSNPLAGNSIFTRPIEVQLTLSTPFIKTSNFVVTKIPVQVISSPFEKRPVFWHMEVISQKIKRDDSISPSLYVALWFSPIHF